jgi:uncharacterized protein (TIGR02271 family)
MPTMEEVQTWRGRDVVGPDGDKVGTVEDIYLDRETDQPEWAAVKTGLFGSKVNFVPIDDAQLSGDELRVGYDKSMVKDAPNVEADGELSPGEEQELYRYYGRSYGDGTATTTGNGNASGDPTAQGGPGRDVSGPNTDNAMTRSEEELHVGTTQREAGRARLVKHIVTENVQKTVPVQREEVRVEREPITDANVDAATDGPELSEEEHEVTLRAEEPVVEKRVVPKERVRLETETHTDERAIDEEVRKERIESEGDGLR